MLVFGHVAITIGAAVVVVGAISRNSLKNTVNGRANASQSAQGLLVRKPLSLLSSLGNLVDIRLILVGSLLPDIIDKPIGLFFFRETFNNGRIFSHTLLFLILITVAGFYLFKRFRKSWLLALSFGTFTHLVLDQMWLESRTLLWPLFGFTFDRLGQTAWLPDILRALFDNPVVYLPEIIGGMIVIWFVFLLVSKGKLYSFIRYGRI